MKKFSLVFSAIVLALLIVFASVPSKAAPRTFALTQPQIKIVQTLDVQSPTFDIVCSAMIFRNINDYPTATMTNGFGDFSGNSKNRNRFEKRFYSLTFPAKNFQEELNQTRGKQRALNDFFNFGLPEHFDGLTTAYSVFENRKNKSSPLRQ